MIFEFLGWNDASTYPRVTESVVCYRVVYETAYRDVYDKEVAKETTYQCCPGWAQDPKTDYGCNTRRYHWQGRTVVYQQKTDLGSTNDN